MTRKWRYSTFLLIYQLNKHVVMKNQKYFLRRTADKAHDPNISQTRPVPHQCIYLQV